MTVGKERSLDPGNNLLWRKVSAFDRERYLACSSSIKSLACLIARGRVNPKIIGSRLSICAFHPRRGDPKMVIILPLYSRFQVMELTSAGCSEFSSGPSAASIFDGVLIIFQYITQSIATVAHAKSIENQMRTCSDIGIFNPTSGTFVEPLSRVQRGAPRRK